MSNECIVICGGCGKDLTNVTWRWMDMFSQVWRCYPCMIERHNMERRNRNQDYLELEQRKRNGTPI